MKSAGKNKNKLAVCVRVLTESYMSRDAYERWLENIEEIWPEVAVREIEEKNQTLFATQDGERMAKTMVDVVFGVEWKG